MTDRQFDHVIYHAGCVDGFTSAWLLHNRQPEAQIHEGRYGQDPPEVMRGHVVLADFGYRPELIEQIMETAERVTILDHHQTAVGMLETYDFAPGVDLILDQDHSGAWLVADWLGHTTGIASAIPGMETSGGMNMMWNRDALLAAYVEDRDLWRFRLPHSHQITAYINAVPMTFDDYDDLSFDLMRDHNGIVQMGHAIGMRNRVLIDQIKGTARTILLDAPSFDPNSLVPVAAAASPYGLGSDAAGELAAEAGNADGREPKIGAYYIDYPDRREFGLRSTDDGPDVAKIAEGYGGGGHEHASGFRVMRDSGHPLLTA